MVQIALNELPLEGKRFAGELRQDIFGLEVEGAPKQAGPVVYDVTVRLDREFVVVEGSVTVDFELECSRCLERFPWRVEMDAYSSEELREGRVVLDLTAHLREDILLALPGYPHCEDSNVAPRKCPAAGRFAPASEYAPISEKETNELRSANIWGLLDEVKERIDDGKKS